MIRREVTIGDVRLILGDCREIAPTLARPAAVISDPPYGIGHVKGSGGNGKHSRRNIAPVTGDDAPFDPAHLLALADDVLLWGADHYATRLPHGRWLAWSKIGSLAAFDSFSDVEFAWHNRRGAARIFSHLWKGICQASGKDEGRAHPTQKPVALMSWCIAQARVPPGGMILDPYCGSGSTLVAAIQMGHPCIGIEIEEKYFNVAVRRVESAWREGPRTALAPPPPFVQTDMLAEIAR